MLLGQPGGIRWSCSKGHAAVSPAGAGGAGTLSSPLPWESAEWHLPQESEGSEALREGVLLSSALVPMDEHISKGNRGPSGKRSVFYFLHVYLVNTLTVL